MKNIFGNLFHFYIDWRLLVVFALLACFFRAELMDKLLMPVAVQLSSSPNNSNSIGNNLFLDILTNMISSALAGLILYLFLRLLMRARLAGRYKAIVLKDGKEVPFGTATILYHPLALDLNGVPVELRLEYDDIKLKGRGLLVNNQHLVGYYTETGKPERRRCGSFYYQLDGNGQTWSGSFVYTNPDADGTVNKGEAKWVRE